MCNNINEKVDMIKQIILATALVLASTINAQTAIWVTVNDINALTSNPTFNELDATTQKALPASRTLHNVYEITSTSADVVTLYSEFHKIPGVSRIEYAPVYETLGLPNDYNLSIPYDYALNLINAEGAWSLTEGDSSVIIGISDAGYYMNNMELFPKVVSSNLNFNMTNPIHGTAVATTAAGYTDNAFGKSSIGYNCSIDLRPMNYNGLLEATYAGAKVINASWAAGCYYSFYGQEVIDEI